jgi:hypothetical protein
MATATATAPTIGRVRTLGVRITALAFVALLALPGVPKLLTGWTATELMGSHRIHTLGEGIHSTLIMLAAGLAIVIGRGGIAPVQQLLVGVFLVLPIIVVGGLLTDVTFIAIAVGLMAAIVVLHPDRALLVRAARPSLPLLGLAAAAAVPLAWLARGQLRLQLVLPAAEPHAAVHHWAGTAFLAAALAGLAVLAALRTPGWRLPLWTTGSALGIWAIASLLNPTAASALDSGWALLALVWVMAFVGTGEIQAQSAAGRRLYGALRTRKCRSCGERVRRGLPNCPVCKSPFSGAFITPPSLK